MSRCPANLGDVGREPVDDGVSDEDAAEVMWVVAQWPAVGTGDGGVSDRGADYLADSPLVRRLVVVAETALEQQRTRLFPGRAPMGWVRRPVVAGPGAAPLRPRQARPRHRSARSQAAPQAAAHLDEARDDILAFIAFPREVRRQIWSSNPRERGSARRSAGEPTVVGIFPGRDASVMDGAVPGDRDDLVVRPLLHGLHAHWNARSVHVSA